MKAEEPRRSTIKSWAEEDRPREKLLAKGAASLTDAELLAILIGTGIPSRSAVDLAKMLLHSAENNLNQLGRLTVSDITRIKGIGKAKAIAIASALELGRRRKSEDHPSRPRISGSKEAFELLQGDLMDLAQEEFWVLTLNRANLLIRKHKISLGGISGTVADPKVIFKRALDDQASAVIVAHNHPSGSLTPSTADIELTRKLKESGKVLELQVLDHLIIAGNRYYSFADEGAMP
jgi:DNA repair protein RadC